MDMLKLLALDEEDLAIVSAHVQDAVMKVEDLDYAKATKQFILAMNRFAWEAGVRKPERRRTILSFARVLAVRTQGVDPRQKDEVLSLLAIRFVGAAAPAGSVELVFAGDGLIRLDVECIEAQLTDLGGAWSAASRPLHRA